MTTDIGFHCRECGITTIRPPGHFTEDEYDQLMRDGYCGSCGSSDVAVRIINYEDNDEAEYAFIDREMQNLNCLMASLYQE